jgi:hypothetical protein
MLVEGKDDQEDGTYPDIPAPRLLKATFHRAGYNEAICSSSPGQETTPTILINRMSPDQILSVVVTCILSQYLPMNLSNNLFSIALDGWLTVQREKGMTLFVRLGGNHEI